MQIRGQGVQLVGAYHNIDTESLTSEDWKKRPSNRVRKDAPDVLESVIMITF